MSHPNRFALWRLSEPLLLASASPFRRAMLENAGIPVEARPAPIDERALEAEAAGAGSIASRLAEAKALAVSHAAPSRLTLGADQTLTTGGEAFHKPADAVALRLQLEALQGRAHRLVSAFCLARDGAVLASGESAALMTMRPLSPAMLDAYVEALAGPGSLAGSLTVGGYQVEGLGVQLFERIEGDHFTIMGLPLLAVLASLRRLQALVD
jgi:septum formation protein